MTTTKDKNHQWYKCFVFNPFTKQNCISISFVAGLLCGEERASQSNQKRNAHIPCHRGVINETSAIQFWNWSCTGGMLSFFSCELFKGATSWYFELLWPSTKLPLNWKKPENNTLERLENIKEIVINHKGTRMVKDAEDWHGLPTTKWKKFRLNLSKRLTRDAAPLKSLLYTSTTFSSLSLLFL